MIIKKINTREIKENSKKKDGSLDDYATKEVPLHAATNDDADTNQDSARSYADIVDKLDDIVALNGKLDNLAKRFENSRLEDVLQNYANPWHVIRINFLVGLARGIGLTLGTAVFFGLLIYSLSQIVTLPLIGEYIAELLEWIDSYRTF